MAQFIVCVPFIDFDVVFFATSLYWTCNLSRHAEQAARHLRLHLLAL
jgi:hypothetical protein